VNALKIPSKILDAIVEHARQAAPSECCGFLAGQANVVSVRIPLENAAETPETHFESSAASTFLAYREMWLSKLDLVAVYHSHPNARPIPSATDRAQHDLPDSSCVIVSLLTEPPTIKAWSMGKTVSEVPIQLIPAGSSI